MIEHEDMASECCSCNCECMQAQECYDPNCDFECGDCHCWLIDCDCVNEED